MNEFEAGEFLLLFLFLNLYVNTPVIESHFLLSLIFQFLALAQRGCKDFQGYTFIQQWSNGSF